MHLSIEETAGILKLSEKTVRNLVSSGMLLAERVGRRLLVRRDSLESLLAKGGPVGLDLAGEDPPTASEDVSPLSDGLELVLNRLSVLEERVEDLSALVRENNALFHELREKDALLALKEVELEKLRRDLVYQQRICEKEIEHHRKHYEELCTLSQKEALEKLALERQRFEDALAAEGDRWAERLSREQENFKLELSKMKDREGLWAKLVKMMTWS